MNLYQKIIEVRKSIGTLSKDKKGYNFSYVTGDQILNKIKFKMDELQLILQPSTQSGQWSKHEYKTKQNKDAIDFLVWGQGSYTWINAENPEEREIVPFAYYGQQGDDVSQAYGTALTYAERYFLLKYFGIPTDGDDPDARRQEQIQVVSPPTTQTTTITEKQVSRLLAIAKTKGVEKSSVEKEAHSRYKVTSFLALTKSQYDELVNVYE